MCLAPLYLACTAVLAAEAVEGITIGFVLVTTLTCVAVSTAFCVGIVFTTVELEHRCEQRFIQIALGAACDVSSI